MPGAPDPVSLLWEPAAVKFMAGVRKANGAWYGIRIADPEPRHIRAFGERGIDVLERDRASTGGLNARDRWRRGFVRAVYRKAKGGPPLVLEVGRKMPRRGRIPPGRFVRGRILRGKEATARRKEQRITGDPARRADPRSRDW